MCVFVVCLLSNTKLIECTLQSFWLTRHLAQHFAELNLLTHISSCTHLKLYVYRIYISMLVEFVNVCVCYGDWVVYVTVKFNSHLLTFSSHHITHITHTQHFKHEPKVSLKSNHFTLWRSDFSHPQTADSSTDSSLGVLQSIEACVVIYIHLYVVVSEFRKTLTFITPFHWSIHSPTTKECLIILYPI